MRRPRPFRRVTAVVAATLTAAALAVAAPAAAQPAPSADGSYLERSEDNSPRQRTLHVYSASMSRVIPVAVLLPRDTSTPRPVLYLLAGAGGGDGGTLTWLDRTDVADFFADKDVNVVLPLEGAFSYYTDWKQDDPVLGRNRWTTFLTRELPPIVNAALGTTGANAIAGLSMSGTSVLSLAQSAPGLYRGVGAFSGCAQTSTRPGRTYVELVVEVRGGGDTDNMWGPEGDPTWVANDPYVNAEKLRGTQIYLSNGTGLPGPYDRLDHPNVAGDPANLAEQVVVGGIIEAATNECTHLLARRLAELGIPATVDFRPVGTHSWGYWQEDLHRAWPMLGSAIGA